LWSAHQGFSGCPLRNCDVDGHRDVKHDSLGNPSS
jgi:hypothetical protein